MTAVRSYALFGGTGIAGSAILATLLRPSVHAHVTALVRSPSKIPGELKSNANLTIVEGDMDNEEAVRKVVKAGKDGVVAPLNVESIEDRIRHFNYIVNAMQDNGYKRLLFWGGAGALTLPGKPDVRLYTTPRYPPQLVEHSKNHVKILEIAQKTSLDWTMLCPPMIYQVPATKVKVAKNTPTGGTAVSNYDQAEFVLDVLLDKEKGKEWFKQQVGLSSDGLSMNAPPKKDGKL